MFGALLLVGILLTHYYYPFSPWIYRYDFLFLLAIAIQIVLLVTKLESPKEVLVIFIFHIVATIMEIFKTSGAIGSWHYPEAAFFKIGNVPLFAGFMYSAVGSYIVRCWKMFNFQFSTYPRLALTLLFSLLIYLNYFSHHFIIDFRWLLVLLSVYLFGPCMLTFTVAHQPRKMPLVVGWLLVSIFIWLAENIATLANVWLYPFQNNGWHIVSAQKIIAWYLLIIISFILVSIIRKPVVVKPS